MFTKQSAGWTARLGVWRNMEWDDARTKWFIASMEEWMGLRKSDPPDKFEAFKRQIRRREGIPYEAPLEDSSGEVSDGAGDAPLGKDSDERRND
jgi:hypothetical protein